MIKVKVKMASNEELMRSGGRKRNKSIKFAKKKRERRRLALLLATVTIQLIN